MAGLPYLDFPAPCAAQAQEGHRTYAEAEPILSASWCLNLLNQVQQALFIREENRTLEALPKAHGPPPFPQKSDHHPQLQS